jgi:hypothetical protein
MDRPNKVSIRIEIDADAHTFDSADAAVGFLRERGLIAEPDLWVGGWREVAKVGVPPEPGQYLYRAPFIDPERPMFGVASYDANNGWENLRHLPKPVSHWRPLPPPP